MPMAIKPMVKTIPPMNDGASKWRPLGWNEMNWNWNWNLNWIWIRGFDLVNYRWCWCWLWCCGCWWCRCNRCGWIWCRGRGCWRRGRSCRCCCCGIRRCDSSCCWSCCCCWFHCSSGVVVIWFGGRLNLVQVGWEWMTIIMLLMQNQLICRWFTWNEMLWIPHDRLMSLWIASRFYFRGRYKRNFELFIKIQRHRTEKMKTINEKSTDALFVWLNLRAYIMHRIYDVSWKFQATFLTHEIINEYTTVLFRATVNFNQRRNAFFIDFLFFEAFHCIPNHECQ